MSDIAKIINESIQSIINEESFVEKGKRIYKQAIDDMSHGRAAEIIYDKTHPEKRDAALELAKKLSKKTAALEAEKNIGVQEHLTRAGKKTLALTKEKAAEIADAIKEHPGLAAASAAGLAAAVGGLAAVRKMRKAAKQ